MCIAIYNISRRQFGIVSKAKDLVSLFDRQSSFMCRLAMRGIKSFGIGLKRAEARIGAKVDCPPAIFGARKILRIGIVKDSSAKSDEVRRANLNEF
jgi:hypothetical protein